MAQPTMHQAVVAYFHARSWEAAEASDGVVSTTVALHNGTWAAFVNTREDEEQLLVHSVFPDEVPAKRRREVALFLTRANFGLVLGNFELDLDDGELRYKTSLDIEGGQLTDALIDHLVLANVTMMDKYLPGIRAVIDGAKHQDAISSLKRD